MANAKTTIQYGVTEGTVAASGKHFVAAKVKYAGKLSFDALCEEACDGNINEGYTTLVNNVKRAELSWQLFAKKHPGVKPDGLRNYIIDFFGKELSDIEVKKVFG